MFDTGDIMDRIQENAAKGLLADALILQAAHKAKLSVANPAPHLAPSKVGEYPKARTFNLRDAVVVEPRSLEAILKTGIVRVGVWENAPYGYWLTLPDGRIGRDGKPKAGGRKGIQDTHAELKYFGSYRGRRD